MSKDLELAIAAARRAGALVRDSYQKENTISKKGRHDYVTTVDKEAERRIIDDFLHTGYSIIGEESVSIKKQSTKSWVIDPIDGTGNFIKGVPFFAVSIGLLQNDNDLILGVVYDPLRDECYSAEKGAGAYLNGSRIFVSDQDSFDDSTIMLEHGRSEQSISTYIKATELLLADNGAPIMRHGSTALSLCYVAKGSSGGFVSYGDEIYDYAGGLAIVKEAGGIVSDWQGREWDNSSSYVVASAKGMHAEIIKRIKGAL